MKAVIQRVHHAEVQVNTRVAGKIGQGVLVFLGVGKEDTGEDARYLAGKITQLRMFDDEQGKMNLSVADLNLPILVVSQFTIYGDCSKGRRPSFDQAAPPEKAEQLYNDFVNQLRQKNIKVETGQFKAAMDVSLSNDGPVTFILES